MYSLWIHFFSAKSLWIHYLPRDFTLKSLSYSRNYHQFTSLFAKSLWIHCLLRNFTMSLLSVSRIHFESTFSREITMNSLSASRFHNEITVCFVNSFWIHGFFAKLLWIYYLLREITMNTLRDFTSRFYNELTIFFTILREIHHLFSKFTMDTLFISRYVFEFTILFPKSL